MVKQFMRTMNKFMQLQYQARKCSYHIFFASTEAQHNQGVSFWSSHKKEYEYWYTIYSTSQNFSSLHLCKDKMKTNANQRSFIQTLPFLVVKQHRHNIWLHIKELGKSFQCSLIWSHTQSLKERIEWWLQSMTTTKSCEILHTLNMWSRR